MTDNLIITWALAADDDFGGSLDGEPDELRGAPTNRLPASGVPYCYKIPGGWQVRIPNVKTKKFDDIDQARAFVALHVGPAHRPAAGSEAAQSAELTAQIVELHNAGLSWSAIGRKVGLSRTAVWQRYQRWEKHGA